MSNKKTTEHHSIPRSRSGSNEPCNRTFLGASEHDAMHVVGANMEPNEVMLRIAIINKKCFRPEFYRVLTEVLTAQREMAYKPEAYNHPEELERLEHQDEVLEVCILQFMANLQKGLATLDRPPATGTERWQD